MPPVKDEGYMDTPVHLKTSDKCKSFTGFVSVSLAVRGWDCRRLQSSTAVTSNFPTLFYAVRFTTAVFSYIQYAQVPGLTLENTLQPALTGAVDRHNQLCQTQSFPPVFHGLRHPTVYLYW